MATQEKLPLLSRSLATRMSNLLSGTSVKAMMLDPGSRRPWPWAGLPGVGQGTPPHGGIDQESRLWDGSTRRDNSKQNLYQVFL